MHNVVMLIKTVDFITGSKDSGFNLTQRFNNKGNLGIFYINTVILYEKYFLQFIQNIYK